MDDDYKAAKEAFVSGMTGSTVSHVNSISSVALASIFLYHTVQTRLYAPGRHPSFLVSWTILVLPLLLSMTWFAMKPITFFVLLLAPAGLILWRTPSPGTLMPLSSPRPSPDAPRFLHNAQRTSVSTPSLPVLPALTTYRAHMMLMTILGILAVDFPVFPRALAKCESYGVSVMDLGVGSFVFSGGVVSAIPLLKDAQHLDAPLIPKVFAIMKKMVPVLVLGGIRVILVKGTDYPEHETEYGTHWNFFLTLAVLPIMQVSLHPLIRRVPVSILALSVALLHQLALSQLGLKHYVKTAPRLNLISANKEGIASLLGYLGIHLFGLAMGTTLLPPSPNFFERLRQGRWTTAELAAPRRNDKTTTELASYAIVWWTLLGLASLLKIDQGVSRQTANLQYVLWVTAFNTSFILGYICLDMIFTPGPRVKKKSAVGMHSNDHSMVIQAPPARAPVLLEAINTNSLALFLLANLGTGIVNLSMKTMYAGAFVSLTVLSMYALGVCAVAWRFRCMRLWRL